MTPTIALVYAVASVIALAVAWFYAFMSDKKDMKQFMLNALCLVIMGFVLLFLYLENKK